MGIFDKIKDEAEKLMHKHPDTVQQPGQPGAQDPAADQEPGGNFGNQGQYQGDSDPGQYGTSQDQGQAGGYDTGQQGGYDPSQEGGRQGQ